MPTTKKGIIMNFTASRKSVSIQTNDILPPYSVPSHNEAKKHCKEDVMKKEQLKESIKKSILKVVDQNIATPEFEPKTVKKQREEGNLKR